MSILETSAAGTITRGSFTYFPVIPGKIDFALRLRRYLLEQRPKVVAIELPWRLQRQYNRAIDRMPQMSVILVPEDRSGTEDSALYIPVEPADPFVEALRTARDVEAEVVFLDPTEEKPHSEATYPDPFSIESIGMQRYVDEYRVHAGPRTAEIEAQAAAMAWKLQGADPLSATCVVVSLNALDALLDAIEIPQDEPPSGKTTLFETTGLFNLHPDCLAEVTSEAPYYQEQYEAIRAAGKAAPGFDRRRSQLALLREAEKEYAINTGDEVRSWQRLAVAKFGRNLAMLDGQLLPGVYDMTLAARSIVDDNYAYEVWRRTGIACSRPRIRL